MTMHCKRDRGVIVVYIFNIQTVIHVYVCILVNGNNSVHVCGLILCDVQLSAYSVNCIFVHDTSAYVL